MEIWGISGSDHQLNGARTTISQWNVLNGSSVKIHCNFFYKTFLFSSLGADSCWWFVLSAITLKYGEVQFQIESLNLKLWKYWKRFWQLKGYRPQNAITFRKVQRSIFWSTDCISPTRWWTQNRLEAGRIVWLQPLVNWKQFWSFISYESYESHISGPQNKTVRLISYHKCTWYFTKSVIIGHRSHKA